MKPTRQMTGNQAEPLILKVWSRFVLKQQGSDLCAGNFTTQNLL